MPPTYCAQDEARNQVAMIVDTTAAGASFVICDRPTGEMHNSPVVCSK